MEAADGGRRRKIILKEKSCCNILWDVVKNKIPELEKQIKGIKEDIEKKDR